QVVAAAFSPSSGLQSGNPVTLTWTDANTGNKATDAKVGWYDRVVLKNKTTGDTILDTLVYYDPNLAGNGPTAAGQSKPRSASIPLPDGPTGAGTLELTVTVDYYNRVFELNAGGTGESNNTSAPVTTTSALAPYPDLTVSGLSVTPASPQSGDLLSIAWND